MSIQSYAAKEDPHVARPTSRIGGAHVPVRWLLVAFLVLLAGTGALAASACTVADLGYVGKTCTDSCPAGLTCVAGTCQTLNALVYATHFRADWATPNAIRWAWTLEGKGSDLVHYALVLSSPVRGAAGVKTWTSADNEELGGYEIRRSNGFDIVTGTITWELDSATPYTAELVLTDVDGHTFTTPPVTASTDVPRTRRLVVFDGELPAGATLPVIQLVADGGVEGGPSLFLKVPPMTTYENLLIGGFDLVPDPSLTEATFAHAYVEFWIRGVGEPESSWSQVVLYTGLPDGGVCPFVDQNDYAFSCVLEWLYHPDPVAPGRYRRVQIPLSAFSQKTPDLAPIAGGALSKVELARGLQLFAAGCPYGPTDRSSWLDRVAVWW